MTRGKKRNAENAPSRARTRSKKAREAFAEGTYKRAEPANDLKDENRRSPRRAPRTSTAASEQVNDVTKVRRSTPPSEGDNSISVREQSEQSTLSVLVTESAAELRKRSLNRSRKQQPTQKDDVDEIQPELRDQTVSTARIPTTSAVDELSERSIGRGKELEKRCWEAECTRGDRVEALTDNSPKEEDTGCNRYEEGAGNHLATAQSPCPRPSGPQGSPIPPLMLSEPPIPVMKHVVCTRTSPTRLGEDAQEKEPTESANEKSGDQESDLKKKVSTKHETEVEKKVNVDDNRPLTVNDAKQIKTMIRGVARMVKHVEIKVESIVDIGFWVDQCEELKNIVHSVLCLMETGKMSQKVIDNKLLPLKRVLTEGIHKKSMAKHAMNCLGTSCNTKLLDILTLNKFASVIRTVLFSTNSGGRKDFVSDKRTQADNHEMKKKLTYICVNYMQKSDGEFVSRKRGKRKL